MQRLDRSHDRLNSRRCQWQRWSLMLLLMAASWRGPIPWCHSHGDHEESGTLSPTLAWHLQWLHQGGKDGVNKSGCHWHFVMPSDMDGDGRSGCDPNQTASMQAEVNGDGRALTGSSWPSQTWLASFHTMTAATGCGETRPADLPNAVRHGSDDTPRFRAGGDVRLWACVVMC